jgi:ParG
VDAVIGGRPLAPLTHNQISSSLREEVSQIRKPEEQKVKRMNLNVPVELHNNFKSTTAAQGENMTDVLLEFIQSYIAKYSPKPKGRRK